MTEWMKRLTPGVWHGHVQPICWACGYRGRSTASRQAAERELEAHECDPAQREEYTRRRRREWDRWQRARGAQEGLQMSDNNGVMEFQGQLAKVELRAPKLKQPAGYYGGGSSRERLEGGSLVITIDVPRPETPTKPQPSFRLNRYEGYGGITKPPTDPGPEPTSPEEPEQKPGESDEAYSRRVDKAAAAHDRAYSKWDDAHAAYEDFTVEREDYERELAEWERESANQGQRFAAWMQLAGVGAVLQGLQVEMTLSPDAEAVERFLPGFSPALALAAPAGDAAGTEAAG